MQWTCVCLCVYVCVVDDKKRCTRGASRKGGERRSVTVEMSGDDYKKQREEKKVLRGCAESGVEMVILWKARCRVYRVSEANHNSAQTQQRPA